MRNLKFTLLACGMALLLFAGHQPPGKFSVQIHTKNGMASLWLNDNGYRRYYNGNLSTEEVLDNIRYRLDDMEDHYGGQLSRRERYEFQQDLDDIRSMLNTLPTSPVIIYQVPPRNPYWNNGDDRRRHNDDDDDGGWRRGDDDEHDHGHWH